MLAQFSIVFQPMQPGLKPRTQWCALVVCLASFCSAVAFGQRPESLLAVPLRSDVFSARLTTITSDGQLKFAGEKSQTISINELSHWGRLVGPQDSDLLILRDGSWLTGDLASVQDESLTVRSQIWGAIEIPIATIQGVVFPNPESRLHWDLQVNRVLQSSAVKRDGCILRSGDELEGRVTPGKTDPDDPFAPLRFTLGLPSGRSRELSRDVVSSIVFAGHPAEQRLPEIRVHIGLQDGSRLVLPTLPSSERPLDLQLPCGLQLKSEKANWLPQLTWLQSFQPRVRFLSAETETDYRHLPFLSLTRPLGKSRNVLGGLLRSYSGGIYVQGLGVQSTSRVVFDLPVDCEAFQAEIGIDAIAQGKGSVLFHVFLNQAGRWTSAYSSPIVGGRSEPIPISVNVQGAQQIALLVAYADRADVGDFANWFNARLVLSRE